MSAVSVTAGEGGVLVVALRGEIDFTNSADVTTSIRSAVAGGQYQMVRVDMSEVTFLDSSGIGVLVTAMNAAAAIDAEYRVAHPNEMVLDQLRLTGLWEVFGLPDARAEE